MALFQRNQIELLAKRAERPGYVVQGENTFVVRVGDWVIRDDEGKTHVVDDEAFRELYSPVGQVSNLLMGMSRERFRSSFPFKLKENFSAASDQSFVGTFRKVALTVSAERAGCEGCITERDQTVRFVPGDWLVTGRKGEVYVLKDSDFRKVYTPLDQEAHAMWHGETMTAALQMNALGL